MKQRFFILFGSLLLVAVLIGLNAASYTQKEKTPDSEAAPNRSTYNSGATGSQAWFSLLAETGHRAIRWQEAPSSLSTVKEPPSVLVMVGSLRREVTDGEIEQILRWVSAGGRLVVIDREPKQGLVTTTANWQMTFGETFEFAMYSVDPSEPAQMTQDTPAIKPSQPSLVTSGINAVQPSRFAAPIKLEKFAEQPTPTPAEKPTPFYDDEDADEAAAPAPPEQAPEIIDDDASEASRSQTAPVVHFISGDSNILIDAPFGRGKIIYLSDPYIVSNAGIGLADNAQLAVNLVAARNELVAFDEFHQGFGGSDNSFIRFFEGTPVVAMFFQALILVGLVFFSQSRRFARPVPEPETDRLSKFEYVSAMAELQQRARAYDLAIENVYGDFRRRAARQLGADNFVTKYDELARLAAERTGLDPRRVAETLFKCEDIIRGEPTNTREVVDLIGAIRRLEQKLGLSRAGRQTIK